MLSFDHEFLVELFRNRGEIAIELLRVHGITIDHAKAEVRSIDLSQVVPTEYRADAVVVLYDGQDQPVMGVVVEVQRSIDPDKPWVWPVYVTALRAKFRCPATLLVVTPEPEVARWAARSIEIGHPGFHLAPLIIGFANVPRVHDARQAHQLPELAVLSVVAHPDLEQAELALGAISTLPEDLRRLYSAVIKAVLPEALRQTLEAQMEDYEYQPGIGHNIYLDGRKRGHREGREQGLRDAILTLARAKLDALTDEESAALDALSGQQALTSLITALATAGSADEARAALEQALRASVQP